MRAAPCIEGGRGCRISRVSRKRLARGSASQPTTRTLPRKRCVVPSFHEVKEQQRLGRLVDRDLNHSSASCRISNLPNAAHLIRLAREPLLILWPVPVRLCILPTICSHPTPKGGHLWCTFYVMDGGDGCTHPASTLHWIAAAESDKTSTASRSSWGESSKRQQKRVRRSRPSACRSQSSLSLLIEEAKYVDAQT